MCRYFSKKFFLTPYLYFIDANNDYELDLLGDVVVSVVVAVVGVVGAVRKILDHMSEED